MSGDILTFDVTMQIIAWMTNATPYCYQNDLFQSWVQGPAITFIFFSRYNRERMR